MLKVCGFGALQPWRILAKRCLSNTSTSIDAVVLRGLKEHYLELTKMAPPPKMRPPSPFSILKDAADNNGPILKRVYGEEEISINVMRLENIIPFEDGYDDDDVDRLFIHVDVSKPGQSESLQFLCGLYSEALEIHAVSMRPRNDKSSFFASGSKYNGPVYEDLDQRIKDALHNYIDERGVNEDLHKFLHAWLYVKEHDKLKLWFRTVGKFIGKQERPQES